MTNEQIIAAMKAKLASLSVKSIKEVAVKANDDLEAPDAVLEVALDVLMDRISEKEFVSFCEAM